MTIGVLALQGDFEAHQKMLRACREIPGYSLDNFKILAVRDASTLSLCTGLVIPGGESTTMSRLCDRYDLWHPLSTFIASEKPVLGTCAGLIMLAKNLSGATKNFMQKTLGALDIDVARNAYGAQIESFQTALEVPALQKANLGAQPLEVFFIRAPQITRVGQSVEVLASHRDVPVLVRRGRIFAASFHPEISGDARLHVLWLQSF